MARLQALVFIIISNRIFSIVVHHHHHQHPSSSPSPIIITTSHHCSRWRFFFGGARDLVLVRFGIPPPMAARRITKASEFENGALVPSDRIENTGFRQHRQSSTQSSSIITISHLHHHHHPSFSSCAFSSGWLPRPIHWRNCLLSSSPKEKLEKYF